MSDQPIARPPCTHKQNKCRQTSMPWVGFEPTIPVFEWAKTFHALDCAATVIGHPTYWDRIMFAQLCISDRCVRFLVCCWQLLLTMLHPQTPSSSFVVVGTASITIDMYWYETQSSLNLTLSLLILCMPVTDRWHHVHKLGLCEWHFKMKSRRKFQSKFEHSFFNLKFN
jgi:hypothetical protein